MAFLSPPRHAKVRSEQFNRLIGHEINLVVKAKVKELVVSLDLTQVAMQNLETQLLEAENRTYLWVHWAIEMEVRQIFQIIVAARTPLSILQMGVALGVAKSLQSQTGAFQTATEAAIHPKRVEATLRSICDHFITFDNSTMCFIHETAREFLLRNGLTNHPRAKFSFNLRDAETLKLTSGRWDSESINQGLVVYAAENRVSRVQKMHPSSHTRLGGLLYKLYMRSDIWAEIFWVVPREHLPPPMLAIHLVAFNGHAGVLRHMLSNKIDMMDQADDMGTTALIVDNLAHRVLIASLKGHETLVQLFLENGAEVNHTSGLKRLAQWPVLSRLKSNYLTGHRGTALWSACLGGHLKIVHLLVENGAMELNFALIAASRGGKLDMVQHLIKKGAYPNARDEDRYYGKTLQAASQGGHFEVVSFLLQHGAEDEEGFGYFESALEAAAQSGHPETPRILIESASKNLYKR
ncbi:ankyrin repeat-containing domain protein [Aspergillus heterothallicus]